MVKVNKFKLVRNGETIMEFKDKASAVHLRNEIIEDFNKMGNEFAKEEPERADFWKRLAIEKSKEFKIKEIV